MFGFSLTEIVFLAVLALIVIGPKQLPEVARTIGRFLNDLKRSSESLKDEFKIKIDQDFDLRRNQAAEEFRRQQDAAIQKAAAEEETKRKSDEDKQLSLLDLDSATVVASPHTSSPDQHKKENV